MISDAWRSIDDAMNRTGLEFLTEGVDSRPPIDKLHPSLERLVLGQTGFEFSRDFYSTDLSLDCDTKPFGLCGPSKQKATRIILGVG